MVNDQLICEKVTQVTSFMFKKNQPCVESRAYEAMGLADHLLKPFVHCVAFKWITQIRLPMTKELYFSRSKVDVERFRSVSTTFHVH